jgi:hypothetical protein
LTAPAEDTHLNSVAILCYFSDVTEAHGPMHYVPRSASETIAGPEATLRDDPALQVQLQRHECSSAAPAGSIFPYGIDVFHRGTNMTAPRGYRYAVMAVYKAPTTRRSVISLAVPSSGARTDHATPAHWPASAHPPGHPF